MGVEQAHDARLEWIKFAGTGPAASRCEACPRQPHRHRAPMNPEEPGGLRNRQTLAVVAIVNLTECLVVDHDRARCQARSWQSRAAVEARMSWPSRSRRSVVRTMSSCNGVPATWAINPIKTAGCTNMRSCNAELAKSIVLFVESMGCANERSCIVTQRRRGASCTVAGMTRSPCFDPRHIRRATEVVLVLGSSEPTSLACGFARCATALGRAITLVITTTRIRAKKFVAVLALTTFPTGHRVPPVGTHHQPMQS